MAQTLTLTPIPTDHSIALYKSHDQAEAAVKLLSQSGYDLRKLSVIGQNYATEEQPVGFINTGDRMLTWGKFGAFWGSVWGLLFGSAMLVIPGIGPVLFAGWLVAALEGALLGGAAAALGGALASIGVPANSVMRYERALKAGSFLVIIHGDDGEVDRAKELLSSTSANGIESFSTKPDAVSLL